MQHATFIREHHQAVMLTHRRDGSPQMSPIACSVDADGRVIVSTRETALKTKNLRRDPRVSLCVLSDGFYGDWIQVDGTATVVSLPDAMEPLVDYYRSIRGRAPRLGRLPRRDGARAARHRADHARPRRSGPLRLTRPPPAILAAGRGSRLGGDASKPLLEWRGRPLVAWAVDAATRVRVCDPVLVVVGYRGHEVAGRRSIRTDDVRGGRATRTGSEGIASSLRAALARARRRSPASDAVCVGLADQPLRRRRGLPTARRGRRGRSSVATLRRVGRAIRCMLARSLWPEALELTRRRRGTCADAATGRRSASTAPTPGARPTSTPLEDLERSAAGGPVKIEDSFRVDVPVDEAWKVLLDLERIAPCMPGAQLTEVEGDEYRGT